LEKGEEGTRRKSRNNIYLFIYLFTAGELNGRSMKPTTIPLSRAEVKKRGAVSPFAHTISYCDFPFPCSFNDILNFSDYAESKSQLIAKQRVRKNIKHVAVK